MKTKTKLLIIIIFIIALFLRIYKLGIIPPSPDWDEVALGYNAYSILKTGRDEYGVFLPTVFRSFDDYKPPLYTYLTIPSVYLFGLNEFAVRFPSAILGTITVLTTFLFVRKLFEKSKFKDELSLTSAFLLAISPWHLQFSRVAFETNVALFFNVTGAWLFLKGKDNPKIWLLSSLFFGLAPYTYHSARVFTPLLLLGFFIFYRKDVIKNIKWAAVAALLLFILEIPLINTLASKEGRLRIKGVSALSDQTKILQRDIQKIQDDMKNSIPLANILHNRRITYSLIVIDGYLRHFDLRWLFLDGDIPRHHAPGMGILYLWELPLLLFGLYKLVVNEKQERNIIIWWLLVAPIPASITTELPHAVRTLCFLPTFQIITAYGIVMIIKLFSQISFWKKIIIIPYACFIIFNIVYYFHQYYGHLSIETSKYWQFGYKQLVDEVKKLYPDYKKIIVSTKLEQPHMFFLFYLKYDPEKYLSEGGTASGGFKEMRNKFDKFEFRTFDISKEKFGSDVLLIGTPEEIPSSDKTIYYLDGSQAIKLKRG